MEIDTIEKFYIYQETTRGNQISGKNTVAVNKLFDVIIQLENTLRR
jgi:hypothetical protein